MSGKAEVINIPLGDAYIKQGDTIPEINFIFSDTTIDLTAPETKINMQVYFNNCDDIINISVGEGITILGPLEFNIDQVEAGDNNFPHGESIGDLEIIINGSVFTYFDIVYTILEKYTKPNLTPAP